MVLTPSTMVALGARAPDFRLPDPSGREWTLSDVEGRSGLLVAFICNHCPFVKHLRRELAEFGREYQARGLGVVAINSNDVTTHPADSPERMAEEIDEVGYTFPYLFDEFQTVARAYGAACTPDFFLYDGGRRLAYRGQFDGSRPGSGAPVTGEDLRAAADAVLDGRAPSADQHASVGCNIKWRPGNEPAWFGT
ncbi:MAG: thioredoxin family protein [Gammaproteobacteria bacterium]|nr:thioredoxin family protein [Gammaproteobacteria bacterium]MYF60932.1 thioredoxin family protein [Gammaproteobacteria bacterium]MYI23271.1 thioredoxin family protein [Gammaproteobacteria bacterium]